MSKRITDYDIQALIDNELDQETEKLVLDFIERNEWAQKRYCELTEQKRMLQSWWAQTKLH